MPPPARKKLSKWRFQQPIIHPVLSSKSVPGKKPVLVGRHGTPMLKQLPRDERFQVMLPDECSFIVDGNLLPVKPVEIVRENGTLDGGHGGAVGEDELMAAWMAEWRSYAIEVMAWEPQHVATTYALFAEDRGLEARLAREEIVRMVGDTFDAIRRRCLRHDIKPDEASIRSEDFIIVDKPTERMIVERMKGMWTRIRNYIHIG